MSQSLINPQPGMSHKDYGKEIKRYAKIMDQVLANSFYLTGKEISMNFDSEKVPLIKDIVMPAINQGLYIRFSDDEKVSVMPIP